MKTEFFKGLKTTEEKDRRRAEVMAAKEILVLVSGILDKWRLEKGRTTISEYDCPSWAFKQAHENGFNDALRKVISLLDLETTSK